MDVTKKGRVLTFKRAPCELIFLDEGMVYKLADFSCTGRGKGKGARLLYEALCYITDNVPRNKQPFRIELDVVPSGPSDNEVSRLKAYYKRLGFEEDDYLARHGKPNSMFATLMKLKEKLKGQAEQVRQARQLGQAGQVGGRHCSLCGCKGVTRRTCPLNQAWYWYIYLPVVLRHTASPGPFFIFFERPTVCGTFIFIHNIVRSAKITLLWMHYVVLTVNQGNIIVAPYNWFIATIDYREGWSM